MLEDDPSQNSAESSFPLLREVKSAPVTSVTCGVIVVLFLAVRLSPDPHAALIRFGYRGAVQVWGGSVWALLTTAVVHEAYWHVGANLGWLWHLGRAVEEAMGSRRAALLVLASAFVSSATQLAMFEDVGFGASGVVYALFGFAWVARNKYPTLAAAVGRGTVSLFVAGLVVGFVGFLRTLGNGAHAGGLAFGACAAVPFVLERRRRLAWAVPVSAFVLSAFASLVGSSRVDLQACKLEYSIVSPK